MAGAGRCSLAAVPVSGCCVLFPSRYLAGAVLACVWLSSSVASVSPVVAAVGLAVAASQRLAALGVAVLPSFRLIPILQSLPTPKPGGTAKNQSREKPPKTQERMRAELASGSDHRLGWDDKPPLTLESGDKNRIFQRVIILIETAHRLISAARAKLAGSSRQKA